MPAPHSCTKDQCFYATLWRQRPSPLRRANERDLQAERAIQIRMIGEAWLLQVMRALCAAVARQLCASQGTAPFHQPENTPCFGYGFRTSVFRIPK